MAGKIILVVDDDVKTVELVKLYLNRDGYTVFTAHDGNEALRRAREGHPDLIVLDLMLPGIDRLEMRRALGTETDAPIIMVPQAFSPYELATMVRAILRSLPAEYGHDEIKCGEFIVNFTKHEASLAGKLLNLTMIEFKLLGILVNEPERVFNRVQLVEKALGYHFKGFDRTIDVHIHNLRRKLEADPKDPRYIKTVYGTGYKLSLSDKQ
jgi:two-component system alkaline phosphatase synthesis response regulator PhoP